MKLFKVQKAAAVVREWPWCKHIHWHSPSSPQSWVVGEQNVCPFFHNKEGSISKVQYSSIYNLCCLGHKLSVNLQLAPCCSNTTQLVTFKNSCPKKLHRNCIHIHHSRIQLWEVTTFNEVVEKCAVYQRNIQSKFSLNTMVFTFPKCQSTSGSPEIFQPGTVLKDNLLLTAFQCSKVWKRNNCCPPAPCSTAVLKLSVPDSYHSVWLIKMVHIFTIARVPISHQQSTSHTSTLAILKVVTIQRNSHVCHFLVEENVHATTILMHVVVKRGTGDWDV